MQVNVTGRHTEVSTDVREYAREKASKLDKFFDRIQKVDVVLDQHELEFTAEMSVHLVRGVSLVGKAHAADMHKCIDQAEQRLQTQIRRFHDRMKAHRDRTRVADGSTAEQQPSEETYEEVVRQMLEDGEQ